LVAFAFSRDILDAIVNFPACRLPMNRLLTLPVLALLISACSNAPVQAPGGGHLRAEKVSAGGTATIPAPVQQILALPKPKAAPKVETYSVVVNNVSAQELLFALARDAKLNVDIHPGIAGTVTLNAIDQTLQQLLTRIAKQVDVRWEIDGPNLSVMPDSPFLRTYKVDYVNMSRDASSTVTVTSQIASQGIGTTGGTAASGNNSLSKIENKAQNRFWETLEKNIKDLLRETDKVLPEGSSETVVERQDEQATTGTGVPPVPTGRGAAAPGLAASPNPASMQQSGTTVTRRTTFREAAAVIVNPETGIINVRATGRQHEKIREFLDLVMNSAQRQVLIEATIAEVTLSNEYQQGIDWKRVGSKLTIGHFGATPASLAWPAGVGLFTLAANHTASSGATFDASLKLLEDYGNVKVLSSPKLSVLNNQTAMLRVVTNNVYFTVKSDVAAGVSGSAPVKAITTTPQTVAVGFVMAVTPHISDSNAITLNIRPSITSVVKDVLDPNPDLTMESKIPVIRTREMESILRIDSGNIAVMGGLMEDKLDNIDQGVPGLSGIPVFGNLFQNRNDKRIKTELVIFLRPVVIRDASIAGDFAEYRSQLPGSDFFEKGNVGPPRQVFDFGSPAQ
jgi:general secretion pathway protein D